MKATAEELRKGDRRERCHQERISWSPWGSVPERLMVISANINNSNTVGRNIIGDTNELFPFYLIFHAV